jgi:hypothetical protein
MKRVRKQFIPYSYAKGNAYLAISATSSSNVFSGSAAALVKYK